MLKSNKQLQAGVGAHFQTNVWDIGHLCHSEDHRGELSFEVLHYLNKQAWPLVGLLSLTSKSDPGPFMTANVQIER